MSAADWSFVDPNACEHFHLVVRRSAGTRELERSFCVCDECGAGLVVTIALGVQDVRPMTALEVHAYGEGPRRIAGVPLDRPHA